MKLLAILCIALFAAGIAIAWATGVDKNKDDRSHEDTDWP